MEQAIFYILSAIILVFSLLTVTSKKILRAAVYLLFVLVATAGLYFLFEYNFLAAVQLTVYAGGVVVLIIFSILLTHQINTDMESADLKKKIFGGVAAFCGALLTILAITQYDFVTNDNAVADSSIQAIGTKLLSYGEGGYVLPFEVISILLLAAMIGAIIIAKKPETND